MTEFLYDTVRFYYQGKYDQESLFKRLDDSIYKPKIDKLTGESLGFNDHFRNMRIEAHSSILSCIGSLPKFELGNNVAPLSDNKLEEVLDALSDILGIDIRLAHITRIDLAYTFPMDAEVSEYLKCLYSLSRHKRLEAVNGQTLNYIQGKKKTKVMLSFYDKGAEMNDRGIEIPADYQGKNLLRYERRFCHNDIRNMSLIFGTPINGNMLLNESFHQYLVKEYLKSYMDIEKKSGLNILNIYELIKNSKDIVWYFLSQLLRGNGDSIFQFLEFIDSLKMDAQSIRRSKKMFKEIYGFASSGKPCDLMKELTDKIQAVARRYNVE